MGRRRCRCIRQCSGQRILPLMCGSCYTRRRQWSAHCTDCSPGNVLLLDGSKVMWMLRSIPGIGQCRRMSCSMIMKEIGMWRQGEVVWVLSESTCSWSNSLLWWPAARVGTWCAATAAWDKLLNPR